MGVLGETPLSRLSAPTREGTVAVRVLVWLSHSCEACGFGGLNKEATWLILPVVICLSQRLSHACLSIS